MAEDDEGKSKPHKLSDLRRGDRPEGPEGQRLSQLESPVRVFVDAKTHVPRKVPKVDQEHARKWISEHWKVVSPDVVEIR
jgi:hypothetical protein